MKRKIMMLVLALGAVSFSIATTKPVGAITRSYTEATKKLTEELDQLNNDRKVGYRYTVKKDSIVNLLDLGLYLVNKDEFTEKEYFNSVEKLRKIILIHDSYIRNLKIDANTWRYSDNNKENNIANLSEKQYTKILDNLHQALYLFAQEVLEIQSNSKELISFPISFDPSWERGRFKVIVNQNDYGYYDEFISKYLLDIGGENFVQYVMKFRKEYFAKLTQLSNIMRKIEKSIKEMSDNEEFSLEYSIIIDQNKDLSRLSMQKLNKENTILSNIVILAEEIPTIKIIEKKISDLEFLLEKYSKKTIPSVKLEGEKLNIKNEVNDTNKTDYQSEIHTEINLNDMKKSSSHTSKDIIEDKISRTLNKLNSTNAINEDTKRNIHFWINDFNTEVNKLEDLKKDDKNIKDLDFVDSLVLRGNQIRQELDEILSNDQDIRGLSEKINALEIISNNLTRVVSNHHIRSSE